MDEGRRGGGIERENGKEKKKRKKRNKGRMAEKERNYCDGWSLYGLAYRLGSRVNEWTSTHSTSQSIIVATKSTGRPSTHSFLCVYVQHVYVCSPQCFTVQNTFNKRERTSSCLSESHSQLDPYLSSLLFTFLLEGRKEKKSFPFESGAYFLSTPCAATPSQTFFSSSSSLNFLLFYLYKATKQDFQE